MAKHRKKHRPQPPAMPAAPPPAAMPGPHEFSATDEQAMRMGQRQARMPAPMPHGEPDADDFGGM